MTDPTVLESSGNDRAQAPAGAGPVVVITGASSGIGRATAQALAADGARLVLAARGAENLQGIAADCRGCGAAVITVSTDVGDEAQVEALMQSAHEAFGRIDVCVAGASVYGYGTFEQTPPEVFRRIVETNLFGTVHTARAVLPHFREQGHGTLIVVGSVYSRITSPYVSAYVTSKWGLLGFVEVLRQELRRDKRIHVCAVLPATIDTPIYQHAANHTGRHVRPLPPVVPAHRVARAIVRLVHRPRPVTVVGMVQGALIPVHGLLPGLYDRCVPRVMDLLALHGGDVRASDGTVFAPSPAASRVDGDWRSTGLRAAGAAGAAAGAVLGGWRVLRRRR